MQTLIRNFSRLSFLSSLSFAHKEPRLDRGLFLEIAKRVLLCLVKDIPGFLS